MNDSAQTRPDGEEAWLRHYASAAQRRQEASLRHKGKLPAYFSYRRREVRLAYTIAVVVVVLLLAAWASI